MCSSALSPSSLDYWESNSHSAPSARHLHANVNNSMTSEFCMDPPLIYYAPRLYLVCVLCYCPPFRWGTRKSLFGKSRYKSHPLWCIQIEMVRLVLGVWPCAREPRILVKLKFMSLGQLLLAGARQPFRLWVQNKFYLRGFRHAWRDQNEYRVISLDISSSKSNSNPFEFSLFLGIKFYRMIMRLKMSVVIIFPQGWLDWCLCITVSSWKCESEMSCLCWVTPESCYFGWSRSRLVK